MTPPPLRFVRLGADAAAEFFALRRLAIRAGCAPHYPAGLIARWTDPATDPPFRLPPPEHGYFACLGAERVATGVLDLAGGRIEAMFVHPAFAGRGIGRAVFGHLEAIARAAGTPTLALEATLNAVPFYAALGCRHHGGAVVTSSRGLALTCVPMTKALTGPAASAG